MLTWYLRSVVVILSITAFAKIWSAAGSAKILTLPDPVLDIQNKVVLILAAGLEILVIAIAIQARSDFTKLIAVMALALDFVIYRIGLNHMAFGQPCPCLGTITDRLPFSHRTINGVLEATICYFIVGSMLFIGRELVLRKDGAVGQLLRGTKARG